MMAGVAPTGTPATQSRTHEPKIAPETETPHSRWSKSGAGKSLRRFLPFLPVLLVVAFNLIVLRGELTAVENTNDSGMHFQMVRWADDQIAQGRVPLDGWYPNLGLGSAHFRHYQSLPHILTAYIGQVVGAGAAFRWSLYLLLATWPIPVFFAARIFGLNKWAASVAAVVALLPTSVPGHGFEVLSYTWQGYGVWSQLWGMWVMPLALALGWRAVSGTGSYLAAAAAIAMTSALHFLTGYLALLSLGIWVLAGPGRLKKRLVRALVVGVGAVLAAAWVVVPVLADGKWILRSIYFPNTVFSDSFGAGKVIGWLVSGEIYDTGRFPILTLLVGLGVLTSVSRFRKSHLDRALLGFWLLSLLLFMGRPALGPLLDLLPAGKDLLLHRFISGVQMGGILLAGSGTYWLCRKACGSMRKSMRPLEVSGAVALLVALALSPAFLFQKDVGLYADSLFEAQASAESTDGRDLFKLIDQAKAMGGGRIYSGLRSNWGAKYLVGAVPVFSVLAGRDADAVGFTLRASSLSEDIETVFDETNPAHYNLLNIRYLILPPDREPDLPDVSLVSRSGRHTLWQVGTTGYLQVVDTTAPVKADNANLVNRMRPFLASQSLADGRHPTVAFAGEQAGEPTLKAGSFPTDSPGMVLDQFANGSRGVYGGRIEAARKAVVMLKSSYDPRWVAEVDGKYRPTQMIAPSFVGVEVPAGTHQVRFKYVPDNSYPWLFALGAAALLSLWIAQKRGVLPWVPMSSGK